MACLDLCHTSARQSSRHDANRLRSQLSADAVSFSCGPTQLAGALMTLSLASRPFLAKPITYQMGARRPISSKGHATPKAKFAWQDVALLILVMRALSSTYID